MISLCSMVSCAVETPRRSIQMSVCLTQNKHYNGPPVAPHCSPNIRHRSSALWLTRLKHITVNTSPRIPVDFKRFSRDVNTTCATVILLKRTFSCHVNEMISSLVFIHSFVHSIAPFSSFFGGYRRILISTQALNTIIFYYRDFVSFWITLEL